MSTQVIGDRYQVIARIGKGGMAQVFRAKDLRLLREVAVKVLADDAGRDEALFYFHREARAIAALRHQNIVQIYDYSGQSERPTYIVMELVQGGNLDESLLTHHPLGSDVIAAAACSIASALQHAHENGVIHRDIKPANVMVETTGRVLLTDFGIAKAYRDDEQLGKTVAGQRTQLFGTPDFMAPEQILERAVGPHTDVFSLGSLIYCMATNVSPFDHDDTVEVLRRVVDVDYVPLQVRRPDLAPELGVWIERCLSPDPQERPTSAAVTEGLEQLLLRFRIGSPTRKLNAFLEQARARASGEQGRRQSRDPAFAPAQLEQIEKTLIAKVSTGPKRTTRHSERAPTTALPRETVRAVEQAPDDNAWGAETGPLPVLTTHAAAATDVVPETMPLSRDEKTWAGPVDPQSGLETPLPWRPTTHARPASTVTRPASRRGWWIVAGAVLIVVAALVALWRLHQAATARSAPISVLPAQAQGGVRPTGPTQTAQVARPTPPPANVPTADETNGSARNVRAADPPAAAAGRLRRQENPQRVIRREEAGGTGDVAITVRPWGVISVDGVDKGNAPLVRALALQAGTHRIAVRHPSLGTLERTIIVKAGATTNVTFDFGSR